MEFPLGYLSDDERKIRVWVDHLSYDELGPIAENGQRPKLDVPYLVYASVSARDAEIKKMLRAIQDGQTLSFRADRQYRIMQTVKHLAFRHWTTDLVSGYDHSVLIHPAATNTFAGRFPVGYLLMQPDCQAIPEITPSGFFEALNRLTTTPLKPSWEQVLWNVAIEQDWVSLCPGYHSHLLRIEPNQTDLMTIVQALLASKVLS